MSELVGRTLELLAENKDGFVSAVKNIFNTRTMATLKISDLSVGDWVRTKDGNVTVDIISPHEVVVMNDYGNLCACKIEDIEPIPITAEILEKNGLYRHDHDPDNPQLVLLSNYHIIARTYEHVEWWRVLIYDEEFPSEELFNGIVSNVHQLQHALRLAGIDKELNL